MVAIYNNCFGTVLLWRWTNYKDYLRQLKYSRIRVNCKSRRGSILRFSLTVLPEELRTAEILSQNIWPPFGIEQDTSKIRVAFFTAESRRWVAQKGLGRDLKQNIPMSHYSGGAEKKQNPEYRWRSPGLKSIPPKYVSKDLELNLNCSLAGLRRTPGSIPNPMEQKKSISKPGTPTCEHIASHFNHVYLSQLKWWTFRLSVMSIFVAEWISSRGIISVLWSLRSHMAFPFPQLAFSL